MTLTTKTPSTQEDGGQQATKGDQVVRQEIRERKRVTQQPTDVIMTCPFRMEELEGALKGMQNGRSPGPDNITNDMLAHLGTQAKKKLLGLFNTSWKTGLIRQFGRRQSSSQSSRQASLGTRGTVIDPSA